MCGISGEVTFGDQPANSAAVAVMNGVLAPRGPDGEGIVARRRVAFGHRRLKIIDLSERAEQPMVDAELGLTLVFNGCIYNHAEIRRELEGKGYRFFSTGDTEVLAKAYHAWGPEFANRLFGMFAFAIFERDSGRVVLGRDRLGIKPLYIAETADRLRFASTLPALLAAGDVDRSIDPVALHHYMSFHAVVPAPRTLLRGVRKLPPATIRIYEPDGRSKDIVYWSLDFARSAADAKRPAAEWRAMLLDALRRAVDRRMVADVPVGVLLSGGVDSSLIVGLLAEAGQKELQTFSIGFDARNGEAGDEFVYSDLIANHFGTRHQKLPIPTADVLGALPDTVAAMSEPMVSHDNVAFYLLSREVARHVTVVQSGQGADEVFGGYHWYQRLARSNDALGDYAGAFFDRDQATMAQQLSADMIGEDWSRQFVAAHFSEAGADHPVDKALRLDTTVMLVDDPVKRVDNMTMAHALEARVPFLDHELVELAARIPPAHKLDQDGKGILKDLARGVIPAEVIDRPKGYFPVPALKYLDGPILDMARDALSCRAARERGLFRRDYVEALLDDPSGRITNLGGSELWQAAVLEMWLQRHAA